MRTITKTFNVYSFDELLDKAKEKAIASLSDINTNYNLWTYTYEDAESIGLKLTSFELDRNRHAEGRLIFSVTSVIDNIMEEHGESCETFKIAKNYQSQIAPLEAWIDRVEGSQFDLMKQSNVYDKYREHEELIEELKEDFMKDLLDEYSCILQREYEWLSSEEAIMETIKANDYEFLEDGTIYYDVQEVI